MAGRSDDDSVSAMAFLVARFRVRGEERARITGDSVIVRLGVRARARARARVRVRFTVDIVVGHCPDCLTAATVLITLRLVPRSSSRSHSRHYCQLSAAVERLVLDLVLVCAETRSF